MTLSTDALDRFVDRSSPIHALDARVKFLLTIGFVLALAFMPFGEWAAMAIMAALLWGIVAWSQVGLLTIIKRAFVALPFALVAVSLLFSRPGEPLFSLALGPLTLTATTAGLVAFISVVLKSWLSVQAALTLVATTHFIDLIQALRALRLPAVLVALLAFAYRYLFVLIEEAQRMLRARAVRSAVLPGQRSGGGIGWRAAVVGQMVGTLFLRSYERSERIYVAMLSRGYTGEFRTIVRRSLTAGEEGILAIGLALLASITFLAVMF
ncbi:MAG TPA: cobalt ECF transporter T component CbiQ [Roseiflexaceae bacterium]|nr:cobalt ECF transporter T component CbiQ [Roseiflexaceae bacterium]HMP42231.1 cobalt ECF transporter T component CbiQ [Roseiflexaceae bacterium]